MACTDSMQLYCSVLGGGECVLDPSSALEYCQCKPAFGPDFSFYHPTTLDCSKPKTAYIGMLLFQTLTSWVVGYLLYVQSLRCKGILKQITYTWLLTLMNLLGFLLGLAIQNGMREMTSFFFAMAIMSCGNAGFLVVRLLVDARYAIEMRSPRRTLTLLFWSRVSLFIMGSACGISLMVLAYNDHQFNIVMHIVCWWLIILITVVAGAIAYHSIKFAQSLQSMINQQSMPAAIIATPPSNVKDEKPDLIKRLRLFREAALLVGLIIMPGLVLVFGIFITFGGMPILWLLLFIMLQIFPLVGWRLERLNKMIQSFQDAKHLAIQVSQSKTNETTDTNQMENAIPMFKRNKFLFYIRPRILKLGKDTLFYYLCHSKVAHWITTNLTRKAWFIVSACVFGLAITGLSWAVLIAPFSTELTLTLSIVGLGMAVPLFIVLIFSLLSAKFLWRHLILRSATFQFRFVLLTVTFVANLFVLPIQEFGPTLALVFLYCCTLFLLVWDALDGIKRSYTLVAVSLSASAPFLGWFLLAFDYWSKRQNQVYWGFFSSYHFAMDMNLILLLCIAGDGSRVMKFGIHSFIYIFAEIPTRYLKLDGEEEEQRLQWGETDFAEPDPLAMDQQQQNLDKPMFTVSPRRTSIPSIAAEPRLTIMTLGSPAMLKTHRHVDHQPSSRKRTTGHGRIQRIFYLSMVVLESDSFAVLWLGKVAASRMLWVTTCYPNAIALWSGLSIGAPLGIWSGFVLTGLVPVEITFLCLLGFLPLIWRGMFKSKIVCRYLIVQPEFLVDVVMVVCILVLLGYALGGFTMRTGLPLILIACTFVDYRLSDAMVNIHLTSPYHPLLFFPIVLSILFLLPLLGNLNQLENMNTSSFVLLIGGITTTSSTGDVFLEINPLQGAFQRIRSSQMAFDLMLAYGVKLLLDWMERFWVTSLSSLTNIVSPVKAKYGEWTGDFMEELEQQPPVQSDEFSLQQPHPSPIQRPMKSNLSEHEFIIKVSPETGLGKRDSQLVPLAEEDTA
ncbi:hypothetical protein BASA81_006524 [Batrachochytrium salamandrivorans]|nr:hypothetical protein BASA81_006524 [Batrachochytrium salamandrivorans]